MDSPADLFDDSSPQIQSFPPAFRPAGFSLIHHLLHPGGGPRRAGGMVAGNQSPRGRMEGRGLEGADGGLEKEGRVEEEEDEEEEDECVLEVRKRSADDWTRAGPKLKRMKPGCQERDKEEEEGHRRRGGRRRREREELKEQLEEARERLKSLQEKVWRAFGEKTEKEEEKRKIGEEVDRGEDEGMMEEEVFEEEEEEAEAGDLSASTFDHFHKRKEELHSAREGGRGRAHFEDVMEASGLWSDCGGDWDGEVEEKVEEGGEKFAEALKLELGTAVARVIDRVLRLYTEMTDLTPSSPPASVSFRPSEAGLEGKKEVEGWMGLLRAGVGEEATKRREDGDGGKQIQKVNNDGGLPPGRPVDLHTPLAPRRSPDARKVYPLLAPPISNSLAPTHPNLQLHHPSLPRPPLPHPPLLPPGAQAKDPSFNLSSTSSTSSSSSSFPAPPPPPPPPPPLPLPLLHYSMQQLFSRSLHHSQLPQIAPSRKDYLSSEAFLEFSAHPSFPPLPLIGHMDPSLARHGVRERERGVRGDGSIRGGGGIDGGDLFLTAGGTQEGLSPCHLKKAKLMFFYTRYPSSNTLKTYFPDVKFNRCVTSQMIKWFSNFREFFYIQMERFARQAVRDALTREGAPRLGRDGQLRVGRDTELYRILNMHYNKSNIYQVPERFIEVSEVALREFYSAIWTGRDSDPCWKKGIYKIICKLDSPLPDAFRMPGCPVG